MADLVSLSMAKSAQRALVLSLYEKFGSEVHIALLSVGGVVAPEAKNLSPENIASKLSNDQNPSLCLRQPMRVVAASLYTASEALLLGDIANSSIHRFR